MNKQKEKPILPILFILSMGVTLTFFYILSILSHLVLWIVVPTSIILVFTIAIFLGSFGLLLIKAKKIQWQWLRVVSLGGLSSTALILVLMLISPLIKANKSSVQLPNRQQNLISPSGKYVLKVPIKRIKQKKFSFGRPYRIVTISDPNGQIVYQDEEDTFPGWFGTYWVWDQQDRAWLSGSDTGIVFYENINGKWTKQDYHRELGITPPESLYPDSYEKSSFETSRFNKDL